MVFLATVDWEDVVGAGTDETETSLAWLVGTTREGSTAGLAEREDS